jgi:hypothetical protein
MKYTVEISETDCLALCNDLVDVDDWIQQAVVGKINSCKKRMIQQWQPKLFDDPSVTSLPATPEEFIKLIVARSDYKDGATRHAEKVKKLENN